ncbi:probable G-protein coupled receptor 139 [Linepithema humile]|uniref:probable G-protein coupled receptor 139 n=1 Tax=Linepithema humile TaxID=83485 RepID=UPI000623373B|nr:PREDICTED: FMRFamide receptor-like [Linepithema humile]
MSDGLETALNVTVHIDKYYLPIFLCLSVLGNSLSVYVLFCTKLRYKSSSIYLGALAMSDIGVLVTTFVTWFEDMEIITQEYWLLILHNSLEYTFTFLSVWIVVTFTFQRYIVVKWPLLRRSLCTVNRAKIIVIGLAGLAVLYSIPFIIMKIMYTNLDADEGKNLLYWWWIFLIIDAIITCFLPATIIVIFNALIVYNIRKQNRIRRNMISSFSASNTNTQSSDNVASHIEVTKMLVIISTFFICLNVPLCVVNHYFYNSICGIYCVIILYIARLLWLANYGMDVVLYCATGKNFRRELICMFTKSSDIRRNADDL